MFHLVVNLMIITIFIVILPFIFSSIDINNNNLKLNHSELISTIHKDNKIKSTMHNTRSSRHHASKPIPILSFSLNMDKNNYVQVLLFINLKY
jgi:hypothetical protein